MDERTHTGGQHGNDTEEGGGRRETGAQGGTGAENDRGRVTEQIRNAARQAHESGLVNYDDACRIMGEEFNAPGMGTTRR